MSGDRRSPASDLTDTLRQVLRLVKEGSTNKEIARMRGVSEQAVKRQVSILLKRFGVENRTELVHVVYESELHARAPSRDDAPSGGSGNSRTCG